MPTLHIIQGGVKNGDKAWIERAARDGLTSTPNWVVPKAAQVGDEVIFYVGGFGFFAQGTISSAPRPRKGWKNRYGSAVGEIQLIDPPISLAVLTQALPRLLWANYPRSITTPSSRVAAAVRRLVAHRRKYGVTSLRPHEIQGANLAELRAAAIHASRTNSPPRARTAVYRARAAAVHRYALLRSRGICEFCGSRAPFLTKQNTPYLEPHHTTKLADDGPDHPDNVIALCPNCHRRAHYSRDAERFGTHLKALAARLGLQ